MTGEHLGRTEDLIDAGIMGDYKAGLFTANYTRFIISPFSGGLGHFFLAGVKSFVQIRFSLFPSISSPPQPISLSISSVEDISAAHNVRVQDPVSMTSAGQSLTFTLTCLSPNLFYICDEEHTHELETSCHCYESWKISCKHTRAHTHKHTE